MEITKEELRMRYADMPYEDLVELYLRNTLTPEANEVLSEELSNRGFDLNRKYSNRESDKEREDETSNSSFGLYFGIVIILLIATGGFFGLNDAALFFFLLIFVYMMIYIKAHEWATISLLGFKSETPALFLRSPGIYKIFCFIPFYGALITSFSAPMPWYVGIIILFFIWLYSRSAGRKNAFKSYRKICRELVGVMETSEQKAECENSARKTDEELILAIKKAK